MQLGNAAAAASLFGPAMADAPCEAVQVAFLDRELRLIEVTRSGGGPASAPLLVRTIIADALRHDAAGMILAHNHPSGDPEPSRADLAATRQLGQAAAAVGVRLYDHLIFAGGECRSLRALGLL
jgi:DNA repair protein RadC